MKPAARVYPEPVEEAIIEGELAGIDFAPDDPRQEPIISEEELRAIVSYDLLRTIIDNDD